MINFLSKLLIIILFPVAAIAHALYSGVLGFHDGLAIEVKVFIKLMKNPVEKW